MNQIQTVTIIIDTKYEPEINYKTIENCVDLVDILFSSVLM